MSDTDKLITVNIDGGLGNQLFMVAACLAYAWDHGRKPVFRYRNMIINETNRPTYWNTLFKQLKAKRYDIVIDKEYQEPQFHYIPIPPLQENTVKLLGYYISYLYFHHHRERLLKILQPQIPVVPARTCTCSLHFRIDDYKKHPDIYPILNINYYAQAVYLVTSTHNVSQIMYFADPRSKDEAHDMVDELRHLFPNVVFVHSEDITGVINEEQEMLTMAGCAYHIIANSTFSWWGAYFGNSQMVCYPKLWIYHNRDTSNVCLPSWHCIEWVRTCGCTYVCSH